MPRALKWSLIGVLAAAVLLIGAAGALWLATRDRPAGRLDTQLEGVKVTTAATTTSHSPAPRAELADRTCWLSFGGDSQRTLARTTFDLGVPRRRLWQRGLNGGLIEYPPTYCDGTLYVNTDKGFTFAVSAATGDVLWHRRFGSMLPSSPAIDGPRLIISSKDGTVTAVKRSNGQVLWRVTTPTGVESSPVVVDGLE